MQGVHKKPPNSPRQEGLVPVRELNTELLLETPKHGIKHCSMKMSQGSLLTWIAPEGDADFNELLAKREQAHINIELPKRGDQREDKVIISVLLNNWNYIMHEGVKR